MKEAKTIPKRNPVAKLAYAFNKAGVYRDKKKEQKKGRQKHRLLEQGRQCYDEQTD